MLRRRSGGRDVKRMPMKDYIGDPRWTQDSLIVFNPQPIMGKRLGGFVTSDSRVLLLHSDPCIQGHFEAASTGGVVTESALTISDALRRVRSESFRALLCQVDGPGEIPSLIRLLNSAPDVPLMALTPRANPALEDLARESGADGVEILGTTAAWAGEAIARALELRARQALQRHDDLKDRHHALLIQ